MGRGRAVELEKVEGGIVLLSLKALTSSSKREPSASWKGRASGTGPLSTLSSSAAIRRRFGGEDIGIEAAGG